MLIFWVVAAALSILAVGLVVGGAAMAARAPAEADPTLGLYRRQMGEIDDLVERGLLDPTERRTAHAEAGRRLLSAAEGDRPTGAPGRVNKLAAAAAIIGLPALALAVYLGVGSPGRGDQPYAARVAEWRASRDPNSLGPQRLAAVLQQVVRERPGDAEGLGFLAEVQIAANDPFQAASNLRSAIAIAPERADLWLMLGEAITLENEGTIVPAAETAFREALRRDPGALGAHYYLGRARIEAGAPAEGLVHWRALLAALPPEAPGRGALADQIAVVEKTGKVPPPAAAAPAQTATPGPEMQAAIRGMVEGLANRLAEKPDDPEGWVRLVRAYAVLGETDKLNSALTTAQARYKSDPKMMQALAQAAEAP
jgi:cytochrome c-type biogenesis protein CcmH